MRQITIIPNLLIMLTFLFSCKKDEVKIEVEKPKPTVEIREVGVNNNKVGYTGQDLHLDALVEAGGRIANIKLQITYSKTDIAWDFVKTYTTSYVGLKNANFHEHIDIPENAKVGDYDLLIIVTDEYGNRTQAKTSFKVVRDLALPSASGIVIKLEGNSLNVVANVTAQNNIAKIAVQVQSTPWTKTYDFTEGDMVGKSSYTFSRTMEVSAALGGHYHVNIFVTDQIGKSITYVYHFDK